MSQNTKTILSNLFTLTSELTEPTSKLIHIEGANETPATQKDLVKGLHENLINLTEVLGLSVEELTAPQEYEPQETVKSIIEEMQELTFAPQETSGNDVQVFSNLLTDNVERLIKALGLNDMSLSAESENKPQELALKAQLQDLHALNDSMFKEDINEVPRFTDGTEITAKDLADMNISALDNIAELIGFELEE
ncbi:MULTISPECIES: hypothetical protein [unclassified Lactococcus]|uniref:hypothetical protein n=1 Tax=Lactococcus TaxID=1357 RepID=UPI0014315262|nr:MULTISPECIES: hypothetical protein [unclassified Lactococcus]KAF6608003.1 hypothetical protein HFD74_11120 [Lactococcus sp. EKM201L]KAF6611832.1 hypothetical protein HFD15_10955 [Lactococcus sp. EKM203L]KAF6640306.1 hypothetical protein HFC73_11600 [Lactococcus sp. EKM501L]KAF6642633.1 hypothetical protein HFC72_11385 [Lactococcus sp. EKM502L]KAF6650797.1 hypothetical protein HFC74_12105 [Lactococcus sp. EKM101L]